MTSLVMPMTAGMLGGLVGRTVAETLKVLDFAGHGGFSVQKLPTDPTGSFSLTLTNVVVGSRVHVEKVSDGTVYYDATAAASTVVISLSAYVVGSALNDIKIKVRSASGSPTYQPYETQATAFIGSQSIFVSQILDE